MAAQRVHAMRGPTLGDELIVGVGAHATAVVRQ